MFDDSCTDNDLVIGGTLFPHRKFHKIKISGYGNKNQIDHITISGKWKRTLLDVRAHRGADIGSDHDLVIAKFRVKI